MTRLPINEVRLRYAREQRGLSRERLASLVGISSRTIVRYENGEISPKSEFLSRIVARLRVQIEWLCGAGGTDGEMDVPGFPYLEQEAALRPDSPACRHKIPKRTLFEIAISAAALSPEDRAALLRLLQSEPHPAG